MQTMAEQMQNILWGRERTTSSPHFSSGIVERAKCERARKSPHARKAFLAWGDFHTRTRFARSTIPEEKWGLLVV